MAEEHFGAPFDTHERRYLTERGHPASFRQAQEEEDDDEVMDIVTAAVGEVSAWRASRDPTGEDFESTGIAV